VYAPPLEEAPALERQAAEAVPEAEPEAIPEAMPVEMEEELSFALPAFEEAIAEPDINLTIPPDVVVQSFEPKYQFNWQNPTLRDSIYPFRIQKLIDFLEFYAEVDLVQQYRGKDVNDPQIKARIAQSEAELRKARQDVDEKLAKLIAERKSSDRYFAKITGADEKSLRCKYTYYLNREIDRLEDSLDDLEDRQKSILKRVDWWPNDQERQQKVRQQAAELDPDIAGLKAQLGPLKEFRDLFDRQAELPSVGEQQVTIEDVMRWELRARRQAWDKMSHDQLLKEVVDRFRADPDRYPEWLIYMVIHFSGMRYVSAHGSWADPRFLLELLRREDLEDEINALKDPELTQKCDAAASELQARLKPGLAEPEKKSIENLLKRLRTAWVNKRALLEYRQEEAQAEIQALPDDKACLDRLVQYKAERERSGDPVPNWVWSEIVKYTPLRLNATDPNWEAYSPERWKAQSGQWAEVLNTWERKDITSWRQKHAETLDLVVTRSVCNEIAEHIQHLRGYIPYAGLTSKPKWYLRMAEDKNLKEYAYLVQAPDEQDFRTGASILWLQWMTEKPSPWQVANSIPGYSFIPGGNGTPKKGQKGEVRKRDLVDKGWDAEGGWAFQRAGSAYIRSRRKPSPQDLKKMGKNQDEIKKITASYQKTGAQETEYLRWRHEATVVDVVDMIDGRYVLTFETGKIGIIKRRLNELQANPMVFVGYVPDLDSVPANENTLKDKLANVQRWRDSMETKLAQMLDWSRILPGVKLPPRVRPKVTMLQK